MHSVTAVGHRGDPYQARENTVASLSSALAAGADAVETDVRPTRDGVPVLLHDATLERLWGHDRQLSRLTADEVRDLTDGGVPTLEEALAATAEARMMIDLPGATEATVRTIVGAVHDCGAADRVYYCGGATAMVVVHATDPDAEIALTRTTLAPPRPVLLEAVRPRWLNYRFGLVDKELADRVHRDGLLVSCWTPDTGRSMRRLLRAGVDSVTTNRVALLHRLRLRTGR